MSGKKLHRLDPPDCGCTDCICPDDKGAYWSQPIDTVDIKVIARMLNGKVQNATAYDNGAYTVIRDGCGKLQAVILPWQRDAFDDALRAVAGTVLA